MSRRHEVVWTLALLALGGEASLAQQVKYEKYMLDNGMTVILHEDHSLPVGAINLWYRVGSKDEVTRRSGFAHLFEHLMFMGTERVPGNKFDTIMEGGGGANNASTSEDRTNYFSSGPRELLPTLLWLDADRLEDLARTMDQEKLDKQRRGSQRTSPKLRESSLRQGRASDSGMLYPVGHPYHIPVIGTHEDLEAAAVADVKDFFATYYVPNNVSLCVAGDFDPATIKATINDVFASLPRGPQVAHRTAPAPKLDGVKRATMVDKVQLPMVAIAYHSPAAYEDGDAEMDLISAVLTQGKSSRLYKRLVYDEKLATEVFAYQGSLLLGSEFRVGAMTPPNTDLAKVERAIDEEIARFVEKGPTAEELERHKATIELNMLRRLQSVEAKADQLNAYLFHLGEPDSFKKDLDRYRSATAEGMRTWAGRVLTPEARVIVHVLPEAPPKAASARDAQPGIAVGGPFAPPSPETFQLKNGVKVMLWPKAELPLVASRFVFQTGGFVSQPERAGAVYLAADMMDEGAGDLGALAFEDAVQALGADFSTWADHDSVNAGMTVLKRNFDKGLQLAVDAIRRPRFEGAEWERVKRLHLDDLKQQDDQPQVVASRVASRILFGDEHPYGRPVGGTLQTVEKLSLDDVRKDYEKYVRPEFATILLAGDISPGEAKDSLERMLGDWKSSLQAAPPTTDLPIPTSTGLRVYVVDRPEAVQTVVRFLMPGPRFGDANRVQYNLLNTLLGGSFTSRLNMNLRENHGYTYGARSSFVMGRNVGFAVANSSVRADVTGEAVKEFLHEFKRMREGDVSAEEAGKARETLRTDVIQSFAGLGGVLGEAAGRVVAGVPFDTLGRDMEAMQSTGAEQLNGLAKKALPLENGVLVLVGDKKSILQQIEGAVPAPIEVDVQGNRPGS